MAQKIILEYDETKEEVLENVKKSAKRILPDVKLLNM
jgi:hypothetical protein